MKNLKFIYFYRDGSNYKKPAAITFTNPSGMAAVGARNDLLRVFMQEGLFIAHQIRVPEVFLYRGDGRVTPDDHCFHEFGSVENTDELPTDKLWRSMSEFIVEASKATQRGWETFDPYDDICRRLDNR